MATTPSAAEHPSVPPNPSSPRGRGSRAIALLVGGGADGNEQLTATTGAVFASGIVLLFEGPSHRGSWALIHKTGFIVWLVFTGLHVLGHLPGLPASLRAGRRQHAGLTGLSAGAAGRWIALAGAIVGGLVLAVILIPHFALWTAPGAFAHHH
jgi:hypothetical protein